jgi:hypothetical protein
MIQMITFKTNHTLIGDVIYDGVYGEGVVKIKQPVQVVQQPTKDGPVMGFAPFLDFCEEFITGITIRNEDILCTTTPVTELLNEYNKIFGSGIEVINRMPKGLVK